MAGPAPERNSADELRLGRPNEWIRAQVVPFAVFMLLLLVLQVFGTFLTIENPGAPWWRRAPENWVYALQTIACLGVIGFWWKYYEFRWSLKWSLVGVVFGAAGIGLWLLPTVMYDRLGLEGEMTGWRKWLGLAARTDGFNPGEEFGEGTGAYWLALVSRFIRAVVVVALVEEIFWRSFVMRLVQDWEGDYWKKPFGQPSWLSFGAVTGAFMLAHAPVDYAGAFAYGALTWLLCVWSKNLGACVVMHAVANLLMGLFAMSYGKYGLW